MKKFLLSFGLLVVMLAPRAYGAECASIDCPGTLSILKLFTSLVDADSNCSVSDKLCYNNSEGRYIVSSCSSCKAGYTRTAETVSVPGGDGCTSTYYACMSANACTETYSGCAGSGFAIDNCKTSSLECFGPVRVSTCSECESGYVLADAEMDVSGCSNKWKYKKCVKMINCAKGWYRSSDGASCTPCPENTNTGGLGILPDGLAVTVGCGLNVNSIYAGASGCFYAARSAVDAVDSCSYSDTSGTYKYTSDCYYSEFSLIGGGDDVIQEPLLP